MAPKARCGYKMHNFECDGSGNVNANSKTHYLQKNCPNKKAGYWVTCHNIYGLVTPKRFDVQLPR